LLVRNDPTSFAVGDAPTDRLHDVKVVQHVVETAIIGQTVEERPNSIFGRHKNLSKDAPSIRPARCSAKFLSESTRC